MLVFLVSLTVILVLKIIHNQVHKKLRALCLAVYVNTVRPYSHIKEHSGGMGWGTGNSREIIHTAKHYFSPPWWVFKNTNIMYKDCI